MHAKCPQNIASEFTQEIIQFNMNPTLNCLTHCTHTPESLETQAAQHIKICLHSEKFHLILILLTSQQILMTIFIIYLFHLYQHCKIYNGILERILSFHIHVAYQHTTSPVAEIN